MPVCFVVHFPRRSVVTTFLSPVLVAPELYVVAIEDDDVAAGEVASGRDSHLEDISQEVCARGAADEESLLPLKKSIIKRKYGMQMHVVISRERQNDKGGTKSKRNKGKFSKSFISSLPWGT